MSEREAYLAERHEYECGKGLFPDLECGCWDGPRITMADVEAGTPDVCAHPANSIIKTATGFVCQCGQTVAFAEAT